MTDYYLCCCRVCGRVEPVNNCPACGADPDAKLRELRKWCEKRLEAHDSQRLAAHEDEMLFAEANSAYFATCATIDKINELLSEYSATKNYVINKLRGGNR